MSSVKRYRIADRYYVDTFSDPGLDSLILKVAVDFRPSETSLKMADARQFAASSDSEKYSFPQCHDAQSFRSITTILQHMDQNEQPSSVNWVQYHKHILDEITGKTDLEKDLVAYCNSVATLLVTRDEVFAVGCSLESSMVLDSTECDTPVMEGIGCLSEPSNDSKPNKILLASVDPAVPCCNFMVDHNLVPGDKSVL